MRWSSTTYSIFGLSVVIYRTTAIIVSARDFAHNTEISTLLPCSSTLNDSNASAQFDEGFQPTDDNVTQEDNTSSFSLLDGMPEQSLIQLGSSGDGVITTKSIAKLSLSRQPGNGSNANTSASPTPSPATSNISRGAGTDTLAPSPAAPPRPSSERSLLATLKAPGASVTPIEQGSNQLNGRDALSKMVKMIMGVLLAAILLLAGLSLVDLNSRAPSTEVADMVADTNSQVRQWVRSLPLLSGDDVQKQFKSKSSYDCLHHQPQSIPGPVRLEGHVVAMPHSVLKAPLAQRNCVLFSASASAVRLDGIRAPPAAFYAMNSDFELDLAVASGSLRIHIRGEDVALFDVASGWQRERTTWARGPEHLQDFLHAHRSSGGSTLEPHQELDFSECRLDVGAHVTCVGELRREATGEISLWPCQDSEVAHTSSSLSSDSHEKSAGAALGLTSWEILTPRTSPRLGKVMISDDPGLLRQANCNFCPRILGWMRSMTRR